MSMLHWRLFLPQVTVPWQSGIVKSDLKTGGRHFSSDKTMLLYIRMKSHTSRFPQHQMLHSKPHFAPSYVTKYLNNMIVIVSVTQSQIKLAF